MWSGRAKVIATTGEDVTEAFKEGALKTLELLQTHQCTAMILKSKSPSCGTSEIYDGTFSGDLKSGEGVCTALLIRHGISIMNELNWRKKLDFTSI